MWKILWGVDWVCLCGFLIFVILELLQKSEISKKNYKMTKSRITKRKKATPSLSPAQKRKRFRCFFFWLGEVPRVFYFALG
ncbi:hypothetical protein CQA40_05875 [Helicobacter sp. MIT 01-3238]|nr:hypothetical protein CQA40_05875 [Helicobacter sp. MIT 01-3238]